MCNERKGWDRFGGSYEPIALTGDDLWLAIAAIEGYAAVSVGTKYSPPVDMEEERRRFDLMRTDLDALLRKLVGHYGHRMTGPGSGHMA